MLQKEGVASSGSGQNPAWDDDRWVWSSWWNENLRGKPKYSNELNLMWTRWGVLFRCVRNRIHPPWVRTFHAKLYRNPWSGLKEETAYQWLSMTLPLCTYCMHIVSRMKSLSWSYAYCCSLEELRVDRNALCRLPRALTRLQKLRNLLVGHNNLTELPGFLLAMKALTSLVSVQLLILTRINNDVWASEVTSKVGVDKIRLEKYSVQTKAIIIL
jgi:hypothetical protein